MRASVERSSRFVRKANTRNMQRLLVDCSGLKIRFAVVRIRPRAKTSSYSDRESSVAERPAGVDLGDSAAEVGLEAAQAVDDRLQLAADHLQLARVDGVAFDAAG